MCLFPVFPFFFLRPLSLATLCVRLAAPSSSSFSSSSSESSPWGLLQANRPLSSASLGAGFSNGFCFLCFCEACCCFLRPCPRQERSPAHLQIFAETREFTTLLNSLLLILLSAPPAAPFEFFQCSRPDWSLSLVALPAFISILPAGYWFHHPSTCRTLASSSCAACRTSLAHMINAIHRCHSSCWGSEPTPVELTCSLHTVSEKAWLGLPKTSTADALLPVSTPPS